MTAPVVKHPIDNNSKIMNNTLYLTKYEAIEKLTVTTVSIPQMLRRATDAAVLTAVVFTFVADDIATPTIGRASHR